MKIPYHPRTPRDFGRLLYALTILNLSADKSTSGTARHLANLLEVDPSMVNTWFRGDLHGNKPLSVENFRKVVFLFWGKPCGLQSKDEVLEFAQAAGEDYVLDLHRKSFLSELAILGHSVALERNAEKLHPTPAFEVPRTDLVRKVHQLARCCQSLGSPLVLRGPPGIGKTILIQQVGRDNRLRGMFPDPLLTTNLNGNPSHATLLAWLEDTGLGFSPLA